MTRTPLVHTPSPTPRRSTAPGGRAAPARPLLGLAAGLLAALGACAGPRPAPRAPDAALSVGFEETGQASWYGPPYHGRRTASGEVYNMYQMTAAHPSLPLGTWVAVENRGNGRVVDLQINDRGPFVRGRILDLSYAAARMLGAVGPGVIPVRLRVIALPDAAPAGRGAGFAVQVAAFASEERARALQAELDRAWPGVHVRRAEVGGRTVYRVRVGRSASRQDAERLARELAAAGHAVMVVED